MHRSAATARGASRALRSGESSKRSADATRESRSASETTSTAFQQGGAARERAAVRLRLRTVQQEQWRPNARQGRVTVCAARESNAGVEFVRSSWAGVQEREETGGQG